MKCREHHYTIGLNEIIDQIWNDDHENEEEFQTWQEAREEIRNRIAYATTKIFDFDYDYYGTATDKANLEKHILKTFYTRDICCDSFVRWLIFLEDRMYDIMPKYKALYDAQVSLIDSDILNPYHIDEHKDGSYNKSGDTSNSSTNKSISTNENESNSSNNTSTSGEDITNTKDVNKMSNTPQAMASAIDSGESIPLNYLSTMQTNDNDVNNSFDNQTASNDTSVSKSVGNDETLYDSNESRNETKVEQYIRITKGNLSKKSNAELIADYQKVILNIEEMISNDLRDLFYTMY